MAAPVFKTIADYVYATDLLLHDEKHLADQSIPLSKDGFQGDLQLVFEELEVPIDSQEHVEWALTYAKADQVELKARHIADDLRRNIMPNVVGMGLQDAVFLLENYGLNVKFSGKGSIKRQSIPKGKSIRKGQNITLQLI